MITHKLLQINQISAKNNPSRVDMPLNKETKPNQTNVTKNQPYQMVS